MSWMQQAGTWIVFWSFERITEFGSNMNWKNNNSEIEDDEPLNILDALLYVVNFIDTCMKIQYDKTSTFLYYKESWL